MRKIPPFLAFLAFAATFSAVAGCGDSVQEEAPIELDTEAGPGVCVSVCRSNADCESSCPAAPGNNCCDIFTGACFVSAAVCPAWPVGPDGGPPY